jgi:hypothetical protein
MQYITSKCLMTWDSPVAVYRSERAQPPFTRPLPAASCQHSHFPTLTEQNNRNQLSHSDISPNPFQPRKFQAKIFTFSSPYVQVEFRPCP